MVFIKRLHNQALTHQALTHYQALTAIIILHFTTSFSKSNSVITEVNTASCIYISPTIVYNKYGMSGSEWIQPNTSAYAPSNIAVQERAHLSNWSRADYRIRENFRTSNFQITAKLNISNGLIFEFPARPPREKLCCPDALKYILCRVNG